MRILILFTALFFTPLVAQQPTLKLHNLKRTACIEMSFPGEIDAWEIGSEERTIWGGAELEVSPMAFDRNENFVILFVPAYRLLMTDHLFENALAMLRTVKPEVRHSAYDRLSSDRFVEVRDPSDPDFFSAMRLIAIEDGTFLFLYANESSEDRVSSQRWSRAIQEAKLSRLR